MQKMQVIFQRQPLLEGSSSSRTLSLEINYSIAASILSNYTQFGFLPYIKFHAHALQTLVARMADGREFLRDHPRLKPYVLSNVQLTGTTIGNGAYGSVEEVAIPVRGAAKKVHDILLNSSKITTKFAEELQLMSTLRHPNIVQFLGLCFFQGSRMPALVMERLLTSLHDLLDPETDDTRPPSPDRGALSPSSYFTLDLKYSVLHNVASGLAYLHEQSPPVIHRDLSAKNVLLNSELVAKIADMGVARIMPIKAAATMTNAPGASVYMPPEAVGAASSSKSKYDASIDIFSFGIVTIFTLCEDFPCDPLPPTYLDEDTGHLIARTELQRREVYMQKIYSQFSKDHPLIQMIEKCLHNGPRKRPNIHETLHFIELARGRIIGEESERNKVELVQAIQNHQPVDHVRVFSVHTLLTLALPIFQNLEQILQQLVAKNAELQEQLTGRETEVNRMGETIMREQQKLMEEARKEKDQLQEQLRQQVNPGSYTWALCIVTYFQLCRRQNTGSWLKHNNR